MRQLLVSVFVLLTGITLTYGEAYAQEEEKRDSPAPKKETLDWNDQHITWRTLKGGLKEAKETKKPIMVLRYATWCGACKELALTFGDEQLVGPSKGLIMVRVDVDGEEAEFAKRILGEITSIPHVAFLSSNHKLLPLAAEDTNTSEAPYYYGNDIDTLIHNMGVALRDEKVFEPMTDNMIPSDLLGKEIFDTSMLLECLRDWDFYTHEEDMSLVCGVGGTLLEPRDVYVIKLDDENKVSQFTGAWRYDPATELTSMQAKKKTVLSDAEKWKCKESDVALPEHLPVSVSKDLNNNLTHWKCKGFELTFLYDPKGVIFLIVAPDTHGLHDLIALVQAKVGKTP